MPVAVQQFCGDTAAYSGPARLSGVRWSLALKYQSVLGMLESLTGSAIELAHIVGGGTQNKLLSDDG